MSGQHRQLSSFVSLPRHSLDATPTAAATPSLEVKLTPRPVYPVRFSISAEELQKGSKGHATQCQLHLQHDEVGSDILWTDVTSQQCQGPNPCFSSQDQPICVWIGDGNLATIADACITIKLWSLPMPASHSAPSALPRKRKATWQRWLLCQDLQVEEPLLMESEGPGAAPQEACTAQELAQETILVQEVLLTAHMARAYEFPMVDGGILKVEVVIGTPQRGPYHLALRQANPGTLFTDHNEDDIFAVLPLPPRARRPKGLPPKGHPPSRPSLQGRTGTSDHGKARTISFKGGQHEDRINIAASGASVGMELSTHARTVRKSTSRNCKQLQFAPLQLGRISEQPQRCPSAEGMADELLSPGRSKSLGAAVDRALLKSFVVDVESDDGKDRPHSATQFSRKVHMQDVTVFADELAALQLVSQGSIQNSGGRRVSRSKQEPLELSERRRSHSRATTPSARDMQTGAPSLDFQIMNLVDGEQAGFSSRCVQDEKGLCLFIKDPNGSWKVWAHLIFPYGQEHPLQLQDIQIILAASPTASHPASAATADTVTDALAAGRFQLNNQPQSIPQAAHPHPPNTPPAHHWSWSRTAASHDASPGASSLASASLLTVPNMTKALSTQRRVAERGQGPSGSQPLPPPHQQAATAPSLSSSSVCEGGQVEMACIAVKAVESNLVHGQSSLAATKLFGSKGGSRASSRAGSRANSRRSLIVPQSGTAGQTVHSDALTDRSEWHSRRRATGDDVGWRGRATDDSEVSGASRKEPCPLALWFQESCAHQASALACLSYALYALTYSPTAQQGS